MFTILPTCTRRFAPKVLTVTLLRALCRATSRNGQLCFAIYSAGIAINRAYKPLLDDLGITYPQYLVLLVLWEHGDLPVKKLGEHLRLDSGTLSPLLKRLETAGLVRRERSTHDERSVLVRLTEDGVALRERAVQVPRRIVSATSFDADEIRRLRSRLDELTSALDAAVHAELPDGD